MLIALRIIGLLVVVALGASVLAWVFTGERKWLQLAWRIFKYAVFGIAALLLLFAAEALISPDQ